MSAKSLLTLLCLIPLYSARAADFVAAAPHPLATRAATRVLKQGGTAADAAVAAALTLAVVEPSRVGLGGGGLSVYYDKAANRSAFFDFLEAVPPEGLESLLAQIPGTGGEPAPKPVESKAAVPGFMAGLGKLHDRFGRLPWETLFAEAVYAAESGFEPGKALIADLQRAPEGYAKDKNFKLFFTDPLGGKHPFLKQEKLGGTLERLRAGGAEAFYKGPLAKLVADEFSAAGLNLTASDLEYYRVRVTEPSAYLYRDLKLWLPGLPSYGPALLDSLLRGARVKKPRTDDPGFPTFVEDEVGEFFEDHPGLKPVPALKQGYAGTVVAADAAGNVVALTVTLHGLFGSGRVLPGTGVLLGSAGASPGVRSLLGETDGGADWDLKRRPAVYFTPVIIQRGFEHASAIAGDGGLAEPQNLFRLIYGIYAEGEDPSRIIKAPRMVSLPPENVNLYEEGLAKKLAEKKLKAPFQPSPYPLGETRMVVVGKSAKALSNTRGER